MYEYDGIIVGAVIVLLAVIICGTITVINVFGPPNPMACINHISDKEVQIKCLEATEKLGSK